MLLAMPLGGKTEAKLSSIQATYQRAPFANGYNEMYSDECKIPIHAEVGDLVPSQALGSNSKYHNIPVILWWAALQNFPDPRGAVKNLAGRLRINGVPPVMLSRKSNTPASQSSEESVEQWFRDAGLKSIGMSYFA
ncbi:hypothetical protein TWF281_002134 [Arthrobotrys megalospora]